MKKAVLFLLVIVILVGGYYFFLTDKAKMWSPEWEESFESFQPSSRIMDIIGVRKDMYVGEIGAGNGRFAVRVAKRVGDNGEVYANDIDLKAVRFMKQRCERERIKNMRIILSRVTNPYFPKGKLDLVYVINAYENFSDPVRLLANTRSSLNDSGRLAIVAYDPEKINKRRKKAIPRQVIIQQVTAAGYDLADIDTSSLLYDNVYIFIKKGYNSLAR